MCLYMEARPRCVACGKLDHVPVFVHVECLSHPDHHPAAECECMGPHLCASDEAFTFDSYCDSCYEELSDTQVREVEREIAKACRIIFREKRDRLRESMRRSHALAEVEEQTLVAGRENAGRERIGPGSLAAVREKENVKGKGRNPGRVSKYMDHVITEMPAENDWLEVDVHKDG